MKKIIMLILMGMLPGCKYLSIGSHDSPPADEFIFKSSGILEGVAATDHDSIHQASFTENTDLQIKSGDKILNKYEYHVSQNRIIFDNEVTILPNGNLTYAFPRTPAVPKGTNYAIVWNN